jgi:hypothetical protein
MSTFIQRGQTIGNALINGTATAEAAVDTDFPEAP